MEAALRCIREQMHTIDVEADKIPVVRVFFQYQCQCIIQTVVYLCHDYDTYALPYVRKRNIIWIMTMLVDVGERREIRATERIAQLRTFICTNLSTMKCMQHIFWNDDYLDRLFSKACV